LIHINSNFAFCSIFIQFFARQQVLTLAPILAAAAGEVAKRLRT